MLRRLFLKSVAGGTAGILTTRYLSAEAGKSKKMETKHLHIAVNEYAANNFYQRDGKKFLARLAEMKSAGVDGLEPMAENVKSLENIVKKLKDNGLESRSIYISGNLHDSKVAAREFSRLRAVSEKAKELGSEYAVFNPAAKRGKSDAELKLQTGNVNKLGAELAAIGIKLALHYHTTELEFAGREFYHLLNNTDPKNLTLCLEQHWSYRGAGNSQIALLEYPRSQLVRETWLNLNGFWDYAITHRDAVKPEKSDGKILVPYPVESALSGVKGNWINEGRLF